MIKQHEDLDFIAKATFGSLKAISIIRESKARNYDAILKEAGIERAQP